MTKEKTAEEATTEYKSWCDNGSGAEMEDRFCPGGRENVQVRERLAAGFEKRVVRQELERQPKCCLVKVTIGSVLRR